MRRHVVLADITGEGVAAIISATFAGLVALLGALRGVFKDRQLQTSEKVFERAHLLMLLAEERDWRYAYERYVIELRRRLVDYEPVSPLDQELNRLRRRPTRG